MIDTVSGAKASAVMYSIAETAKANCVNTYKYFELLLSEMPKHMDDKNLDFIEELLPWSEYGLTVFISQALKLVYLIENGIFIQVLIQHTKNIAAMPRRFGMP